MFDATSYKVYSNNSLEYLHVSKCDSSGKNIILLHGLFGGLSNFDGIISCIHDYNIYVPALPLYDYKSSEISISKLSSWLHGFMDYLEIEAAVLLGNSLGGHIALDYVLKYPARVSSLVLTGSSGIQERDFGDTFPRRNDREYIRQQAALTFYNGAIEEDVVDEIMEVVKCPSKLRNILALTRDTHDYELEGHLSEIHKPTLLIWGRNDEITPPEVARTFKKKLPDARLQWIDKCGHAPMMEHPEEFAFLLNEFLLEVKTENPKRNNIQL